MSTPQLITTIKKNDTFSIALTLTDDGVVRDLTGVSIASSVRTDDSDFIAPLTIEEIVYTSGRFRVRGNTATWPIGLLVWDVQFVEINGFRWSTPDRGVYVVRDSTT